MVYSDEDNEREYEREMDLTGFMFGNIDENGQLEDDILDSNAKQHLSSLYQLGLGSILQEMVSDEPETKSEDKSDENSKPLVENGDNQKEEKDDVDYVNKSPTAEDFSDINELAEECSEQTTGKFHLKLLN